MSNRKFEVVEGVHEDQVNLPTRATKGSAGYDISSLDEVHIQPKQNKLVRTGVKVKLGEGEYLAVHPRSSLFNKKGLILVNSVAVIDEDYHNNPDNDGEFFLNLYNLSDEVTHISEGERIAQGIFHKYLLTDDDEAQGERTSGLGSTGE